MLMTTTKIQACSNGKTQLVTREDGRSTQNDKVFILRFFLFNLLLSFRYVLENI